MTNPSSMNSGKQQSGQPAVNYSNPYYQPSQPSYPNYSYPSQQGMQGMQGQAMQGQGMQGQTPTGQQGGGGGGGGQSMLPTEESYIENILRLNRGKPATVYMTFENNREWNAKIFKGIVEAAGRDHIILSDAKGMRYLLPMIYLDYVTFEGEIQYSYPYNGTNNMVNYPPR